MLLTQVVISQIRLSSKSKFKVLVFCRQNISLLFVHAGKTMKIRIVKRLYITIYADMKDTTTIVIFK